MVNINSMKWLTSIFLLIVILGFIIPGVTAVTWSSNQFNNSLTNENLTFTGNQNITRYLNVPQYSFLTDAYLNLSGYNNDTLLANNVSETINTLHGANYLQVKQLYINNYTDYITDYVKVDANYFGGIYRYQYNDSTTADDNTLAVSAQGTYVLLTRNNPYPNKNVVYINVSIKSTNINSDAYEKNMTAYKQINFTNVSFYTGNNKSWNYSGVFNQVNNKTSNFANNINLYLSTCAFSNGFCSVPFIFHSDTAGILQYSGLQFAQYPRNYNNVTIVLDANYTPPAFDNITIVLGPPPISIDYSVVLPLGFIRYLNCSPDFENPVSIPEGQSSLLNSINATNNALDSLPANLQIKINQTAATGWKLFASNQSDLSQNISLNTSWQTIYSSVDDQVYRPIWLFANCSFINSNARTSIEMQAV